jgi:hypothetical protein
MIKNISNNFGLLLGLLAPTGPDKIPYEIFSGDLTRNTKLTQI